MTLEEILAIDKSRKQILIIGMPAAGKTWLAISRAAQRVIYVRERDPDKLKHLKRFHEMNTKLFQEWTKIATHDTHIIPFTNEYEPCYSNQG